jgi:hypothetical protein
MKSILIAALAIIMAAVTPALSMGRQQPREAVSIEVVSDSGSIFQTIPHDDFWKGNTHVFKQYLEAKNGEKYGIIIRNRTTERIGVVIAVDGRNIISGKQSNLQNNEMMYIVEAWGATRLDGWRTSQDQVNRFYFTDATDSYTIKTFGDSSALGVIAMAVYKEKPQPKLMYKQKSEAPAAAGAAREMESKKSADRALANESAGTGFGEAQYSPVITVQFEPERTPMQKTLVKYEWHDTLCRKGILPCGQQHGNRLWDENQYAPYPPGYPRN